MANGRGRRGERVWTYEDAPGVELSDETRERVIQRMIECETIGHTCGGVFFMAPRRVAIGNGEYVTDGWAFRWSPTAPAAAAPADPSDEGLGASADA